MTFRPTPLFKELLACAEKSYGKRSTTYQFALQGRDSLIPETLPPNASGKVVIHFANKARNDYDRLRLQLAHEAIHFVCGGFKRRCLVFEEGLATHFSLVVSTPQYASAAESSLPQLFANALCLFRQLDPRPEQIRELRAYVLIDDLQPATLQKQFGASNELACALCERVSADDADRFSL